MTSPERKILVTGAGGFIGTNLVLRLKEISNFAVVTFIRGDDPDLLPELISIADAVVHLAGENRPEDETEFERVNVGLTTKLCNVINDEINRTGRHIPLIFTSSSQAVSNNLYGQTKLAAEKAIRLLAESTENPCVIFRLPGVFGKWSKPNYNSVVATFCHNLARDLPIQISDLSASLNLVYIDDVINAILKKLEFTTTGYVQSVIEPEYRITLGELANQIRAFARCRSTLEIERVGTGLVRALYATYVSYLPKEKFSYELSQYADSRGVFVEMLKTLDCGQISYFSVRPGASRGGHYHHSKTEKFLVIKGNALFKFKHMVTDESIELIISSNKPKVVDTVPGWSHSISNIGDDDMFVMLWANENFDYSNPDTITSEV